MSDLFGVGEFSLADKLQPESYIQERARALRELHKLNPDLASRVVSYAWPHPAERNWTDDELRERLGVDAARRVRVKAASVYLGKYAEGFVDTYMPSMGAAFDAFKLERMRQEALSHAENVARYPALHFTQPVMMNYAMGGGDQATPPVHHRRHHKHGEEEKVALTRWQKEEPGLSPDEIRSRRTAYFEPVPELSPEQLARHRDMRAGQARFLSKAQGVETELSRISPVMTSSRVRNAVAPVENTAKGFDNLLETHAPSIAARLRAPVKKLFEPFHTPLGNAATFLRHFSSVR